jgi:hypothetical protein
MASEQSIDYCPMTLEDLAADLRTPIAMGCRFGCSDQQVRYNRSTPRSPRLHDGLLRRFARSAPQPGDSLGSADRSAAEFHDD